MSKKPLTPGVAYFRRLAYDLLWFAVRAFMLMIAWNLVAPDVLGVTQVTFGQSFMVLVIVQLMFTNLNTDIKVISEKMNHMSQQIFQLSVNQITQNNGIATTLQEISDKLSDSDVHVEETISAPQEGVDEGSDIGYNTRQSENQQQ